MGDPETEAVLPRLNADILDLFDGVARGTLDTKKCAIYPKTAVTVVLVSGGYPEEYQKGFEIKGISTIKESTVFHAGTSETDNKLVTSGGRVLAVTALSDSLPEAMDAVYNSVRKINFEGYYYRRDIGKDLLMIL
jgi:phosphoribosylamine--glycine ligase